MKSKFSHAQKSADLIIENIPHRVVKRGAKPELLLQDGKLTFDGQWLEFGVGLEQWRKIIGVGSHCSFGGVDQDWCKWDTLGIEISGELESPRKAKRLKIRFSHDKEEDFLVGVSTPSGNKFKKADWHARGSFRGYFEIDGFGVDATVTFRE
ncbi:DUF7738 domain-containing protein [Pseudoduganella lurida]|uniref:DUF7738 domain-containing protein n=1 Tax=Pseudoduganella lurida TaxID=1036180 RepID=UPI00119D4BCB|nr:hypothetical protein [Pseudoduganella lurida]